MNTSRQSPSARNRGFTMAELMVTVTILSLVMVGVARFTIQALNIYKYDEGRIRVNKDIRSFTERMTTDAVFSNYHRIFPSFTNRSIVTGGVTYDLTFDDGLSGDMMVLVFCDTDPGTGKTVIKEMIGYYRDPADTTDPTSTGPVRRFDVTIPNIDPTTIPNCPLSTLLNTYVPVSGAHTNPIVVQLAQGLSNGTLFYNFFGQSAMIKGQIIEQGNQFRRAVNTYNFTVSPRG